MASPEPSGIVTLTTDFGLTDHYVGVMKGVILSICPTAKVVDLTHGVEPQQIEQGAFFLAQGYRYFPEGTVHVAVVDPGVGTSRRCLYAEADGHYFVAPDNGVLTYALDGTEAQVYGMEIGFGSEFTASRTFHGRDFFAPLAASIVKRGGLNARGEPTQDYERLRPLEPELRSSGRWRGRVLNVDRFGNLVTNLTPDMLALDEYPFVIRIGDAEITRFFETYADAETDEPFAIVGSAGYIEISVQEASAAEDVDAWLGDEVELELIR